MKPAPHRGMTLTEIMVVIAIIALVSSIILLSFGKIREVVENLGK